MRILTIFFVAVAMCLYSVFSYASIPSNAEELHMEIDQAQEQANELEVLWKTFNLRVNNAKELYQGIVERLKREEELITQCGFNGEPYVIFPLKMLPEELWLELEAVIRSQGIIRVEQVVLYSNSPAGVVVTEKELREMSDLEWQAIRYLSGLCDKESFIDKSEIIKAYSFSLIR